MVKVLAVASGGGHWKQLMKLRDVFGPHQTTFATTSAELGAKAGVGRVAVLPDCNRDEPLKSLRCLLSAVWLVIRIRPDVVISTGAAPGLLCLLAGRLTGARTLWIDSVANAEQLSVSGRLALRLADEVWTQWPHLATADGPRYEGAVL